LKIKIPEYIKEGLDKYKYILLVCALGIVLMLIPTATKTQVKTISSEEDTNAHLAALEKSAEKLFSKIHGVGKVEVKITVKSGYEKIYAADTDERISTSGENYSVEQDSKIITVNTNGTQKPLMVKTAYPEYLGAVIVCEGGDNSKVKLELTQAMKSLTGIPADNIVVAKMK